MPSVTVIISSYGPTSILGLTLQSIARQSFQDWKILLIRDGCEEASSLDLGTLEKRVEVINLPIHCGHQYGPNSVGIRLADTEFIAFMNHDDLWLSDHLEYAVSTLINGSADVYFGRAVFCHGKGQTDWYAAGRDIAFSEYNRPEYFWRSLYGPFYFFEPASSWVVRTSVAKRVGDWARPDEIDVTPVMNWFSRVFRVTEKVNFGEVVTTLKNNLHNFDPRLAGTPRYLRGQIGCDKFIEILRLQPDLLRKAISLQVADAGQSGLLVRDEMAGFIEVDESEKFRIDAFHEFLRMGFVSRIDIGPTIGPYTTETAVRAYRLRTGSDVASFPSADSVYKALHRA